MKKYIVIFLCLAGLAMAAGYTDWQQGAIDGLKMGWNMREAYDQAMQGINVSGYNAEVDKYNAWVGDHFGNDANLFMQKMDSASANLQRPYAVGKNITNNGIVHAIDASGKFGPQYTTNDINLLSDSAINAYHNQDRAVDANGNPLPGTGMGDGYLGGI